jgi:adenylate cyclase
MTLTAAIRNMPHNNSDTAPSQTMHAESEAGLDIEALSPRQLRTVLVCDVVESVRWMEQDEDNAISRWSQFAAMVRSRIAPEHGGSVVKSTGDGLMIEFPSAHDALSAANAMQNRASEGNSGFAPDRQMFLRVGIHQTQARRDAHDMYGHGINLAARITTLAGAGEIVVTPEVRDHLTDRLDGQIEDLGECYLKHLSEPQRVYRIHSKANAQPWIETSSGGGASPFRLITVAVLPFASIEDVALGVAGDALADGLISHLSKTSELRVISRLTTNAIVQRSWDSKSLAHALGANYLITTQCWSLAGKLLVSHELVDAESDSVILNKRYTLTLEDILACDCGAVFEMAADLLAALRDTEVQRAKTSPLPNIQSAHALMAGITLMHRTSRRDFQRAYEVLEHLQSRHPRHSQLQAWLAKWHVLEAEQGWSSDRTQSAMKAIDRSRRALDLDDSSSMALSIDGFVRCNLLKDFDGALVQYERALQANASDSLAWLFKSMLHAFKGENDLSVPALNQALNLSPLDPNRYFFDSLAASVHLSAANYGMSIEFAKRSLRANCTHVSTHRALTIAQVLAGQVEQARESAKRLIQLDPALTVSGYLQRSPGVQFGLGRDFAYALREAGVPE